ncbi:hypothetical protein BU17DRAFT_70694 [Hysterangium stoloniferum]|nr:hypothetical protein BU17DRAFT_70694 [Hysterangium stoloniferum]
MFSDNITKLSLIKGQLLNIDTGMKNEIILTTCGIMCPSKGHPTRAARGSLWWLHRGESELFAYFPPVLGHTSWKRSFLSVGASNCRCLEESFTVHPCYVLLSVDITPRCPVVPNWCSKEQYLSFALEMKLAIHMVHLSSYPWPILSSPLLTSTQTHPEPRNKDLDRTAPYANARWSHIEHWIRHGAGSRIQDDWSGTRCRQPSTVALSLAAGDSDDKNEEEEAEDIDETMQDACIQHGARSNMVILGNSTLLQMLCTDLVLMRGTSPFIYIVYVEIEAKESNSALYDEAK